MNELINDGEMLPVLLVSFQQSAEGDEPEFGVFVHHCRGRQVI